MRRLRIMTCCILFVVSCKNMQQDKVSGVALSPLGVIQVKNKDHLTILNGQKIDLTTYIASETEVRQLANTMRSEVMDYAEYHGRTNGGFVRISDVETGMIYAYTSNEWYKDWNRYLRDVSPSRPTNLQLEAEVKLLATVLNKYKTTGNSYTGFVFRGAAVKENYFRPIVKSCNDGGLAIAKSFFSTSLTKEVAKSYSKLNPEQVSSGNYHSVIYHVIVENEPGISFNSQYASEKEVLVLPNNIFQLVGILEKSPIDGKAHIYIKELNLETIKPVSPQLFMQYKEPLEDEELEEYFDSVPASDFQLPEGVLRCKEINMSADSTEI